MFFRWWYFPFLSGYSPEIALAELVDDCGRYRMEEMLSQHLRKSLSDFH